MKLLNVFGLVVGAHLAVLAIIFATPGCRSSSKTKPRPNDTAAVPAASAEETAQTYAPMQDGDVNAVTPVTPVAPVSATPTDVGSADLAAPVRQAPMRPSALPPPPPPAPVAPRATYTVVKGDSLWTIAKKHGVSVAELAAANQLSASATLRLGQTLNVPSVAAPAVGTDAANLYEVKSGDVLGSIARRHGTSVAALRTANNLSGDNLRVGQKLVIPGNASVSAPAADLATRPAAAPVAGSATYTVVAGDTLGGIARRTGVKVGELATLNTITDPAKLRVGQTLRLPAGAVPAAKAAQAEAAAPAPAAVAPEPAPTPVSTVEPMAVPVIRID